MSLALMDDFYYMNAKNSADKPAQNATGDTPSTHAAYCIAKRAADCDAAADKDACKYDKALCINEDNQKKINNLQLKHDGADERHGDINIYYNRELLKTYNLGIGIVGVGIMIYFFYK
jgi:hypothetical protein